MSRPKRDDRPAQLHEWETFTDRATSRMICGRLAVPNGWIYTVAVGEDDDEVTLGNLVFVPDHLAPHCARGVQ